MDITDKLKEAAGKLAEKAGFYLVEFNTQKLKGNRLKAAVVIHKKGGVTMDDCADLHKVLFPRLELIAEEYDFYLEISSPGINRTFKDNQEYSFFVGEKAKVLTYDESDYIRGVIEEVNDTEIVFKTNDGVLNIKIENIQKGKLDY